MPDALPISDEVEKNGFFTCRAIASPSEIAELLAAISRMEEHPGLRKKVGVFAVRNLLEECPEIRKFASSPSVRHLVEPVLGTECFPVRGILFDKVPEANWKVPWHQDVTIAVQNRIDAGGFGPWSTKADVLHVQSPAAVLNKMLSLRLHLDPCREENGALRLIPGSHRQGRIAEELIPAIREASPEHVCVVGAGDVLLMRPLLLHASSASRVPSHRRVVHIDFAAVQLPAGMGWFFGMDSLPPAKSGYR